MMWMNIFSSLFFFYRSLFFFYRKQKQEKMSCPQEPQKPLFSFGNPLRLMRPKGSTTSSKLASLLNTFEQTLSARLTKLSPKENESVLSLSWMASALHSVSESHTDIKSLLVDLDLPVDLWEDKWITVYLDNTVKLLDVCTAFSSEISRLSQGNLLLKCLLHSLDLDNQNSSSRKVRSSLDSWRKVVDSKNPRIENCCSILDKLVESLNLPKIKNNAKGKVLMQAVYGVRVHTVLVCSIIVAAFTGSMEKLTPVQVAADSYPWAVAYAGIQACVHKEIRKSGEAAGLAVVELEAVDECMKNLLSSTQIAEGASKGSSISELRSRVAGFSDRLDVFTKEVDGLFRIVLNGRDALLGNLRASTGISGTTPQNNKKELMMR